MVRFILIYSTIIVVFYSCSNSATVQPSDDKKAIKAVLAAQEQNWNEGNIEGFMKGYWKSDSLSFIGSKGIVYGWEETLENYKESYPDAATMGRLNFEILQIELLSEQAARVVGKYTLYREKDEPSGFFTLFWKKINGAWKIVSDQTCG